MTVQCSNICIKHRPTLFLQTEKERDTTDKCIIPGPVAATHPMKQHKAMANVSKLELFLKFNSFAQPGKRIAVLTNRRAGMKQICFLTGLEMSNSFSLKNWTKMLEL
jgi:hypothetical protein